MITKYFSKVTTRFDPFTSAAKPARIFLARIPHVQKSGCQVDCKVIHAPEKPSIKVAFKDKLVLEIDPSGKTMEDLREFFDAYSRKLALKEALDN